MKKLSVLVLLFVAIAVVGSATGCGVSKAEFKRAYIEQKSTNSLYDGKYVNVLADLGTYNGNSVFVVKDNSGMACTVVTDIVIDGVYFLTAADTSTNVYVYLDPNKEYPHERIILLEKAYEKGYVTKNDLMLAAAKARVRFL